MESSAESDDETLYPFDPEAPLISPQTYYFPVGAANSSINVAIQRGDLEKVVQLLNDGKELNLADSRGFTALHVAAHYQNLEILEVLLQQPLVRKNVRTHRGETPLFLSILGNADDAVIIKLIESGCDVNIPNLENVTPLSLAVRRDTINVAHLLIEKGADVDAKDFDGYTPLHNAVTVSRYEAVCMLLYYNASVNEISFNAKVTPFMLAINSKEDKIAEVLFDYITDFNSVDHEGSSTLFLAIFSGSLLAKRILLLCGNINNVKDSSLCLKQAMRLNDNSLFKEIFSKINHVELAHERRFLEDFMYYCDFNILDFMECLHLILGSQYSRLFTEKCRTIIPLIQKFYCEKISQEDRVKSLYLLFASGLSICYYEFWYIYRYFGFNKELETVFIAQPIIRSDSVCTGMFHFTENCINIAWNIFYNYCGEVDELEVWRIMKNNFQEVVVDFLRYFTIDYCCKENYFRYYHKYMLPSQYFGGIVEQLNRRNIASLKEMCRNEIRKIIITRKKAKNMYKVYDNIKALPVPKVIQDILHLKQPLYS